MGRSSRRKGRVGESEAKLLLQERDWEVADLTAGCSSEDLWATDPNGVTWSVEIKNRKLINIAEFRKQAVANAGKKPWMLLVKLDCLGEWLVIRKGEKSTVWKRRK